MKNQQLILLIILTGLLFGCKSDNHKNDLDCELLNKSIVSQIDYDDNTVAIIKTEIDKITADLSPVPTSTDPPGYLANFNELFKRLEACGNIKFEMHCYGCIETGIPQSEVVVIADSSGVQIKRIFDFYTSEKMNLTFSGVHNIL